MCIETINKNRKEYGFKELTGDTNIGNIEILLPNATCLLTYKQWQSVGRVVNKGEKSFRLKGAKKFKNKKGEEETKFYNFCVFDESQTHIMDKEETKAYEEKNKS